MTGFSETTGIVVGDFDLDEYFSLLSMVSEHRYELLCSEAAVSQRREWLFLRHDVDYSVECALKMAEAEANRGHRSTYFFQLACDHYNLLSGRYAGVANEVASMGHEVGLHYDVRAMEKWGVRDSLSALEAELDTLSALLGSEVKSISMHNPSVYGTDPFAHVEGVVNAYNLAGDDVDYFSDSCGAWRNKTYKAFADNELKARVQLLIHPIYWAEGPGDRWQRLDDWAAERRDAIEEHVTGARELWMAHTGVLEHDARSLDANLPERP